MQTVAQLSSCHLPGINPTATAQLLHPLMHPLNMHPLRATTIQLLHPLMHPLSGTPISMTTAESALSLKLND